MSGLLASIFRSHWTVKSHSFLKFSLTFHHSLRLLFIPAISSFQSTFTTKLPVDIPAASGYTVPRYRAFHYILSAPASLQRSLTTWAIVSSLLPHILHKAVITMSSCLASTLSFFDSLNYSAFSLCKTSLPHMSLQNCWLSSASGLTSLKLLDVSFIC